jgi:hypothetical protein
MEQPGIARGAARAPFMEHRWGQRMPCRARVTFLGGPGIEGAGRVRDISSSGAFIETASGISVHSRILLTVTGNESSDRAVDIPAIVVRTAHDGIGIEWCETPEGLVCTTVGCRLRCGARETER